MTSQLNVNSGELTTIRLYGKLGSIFGRSHRLAVRNAAEAVRALCCQLPGFERYLTESKDNGFGFSVFYGKSNLKKEDLCNPSFGEEIRIAPILFGSKSGGWFQVIVGVALIVVGTVLTVFGMGIGIPLIKMGVAMTIGGVVQLLAPAPPGINAQDRPDNRPSYAFNGPVNTQAQGHPVPVIYGECIVGSAVLSAGISAEDQAYIPSPTVPNGSGGRGGNGAPPWHGGWLEN